MLKNALKCIKMHKNAHIKSVKLELKETRPFIEKLG